MSMMPPPWISIRVMYEMFGVVDQAALAGVGEVVVGQRVAADVDVAAVAGCGRGQALAGVLGVKRSESGS